MFKPIGKKEDSTEKKVNIHDNSKPIGRNTNSKKSSLKKGIPQNHKIIDQINDINYWIDQSAYQSRLDKFRTTREQNVFTNLSISEIKIKIGMVKYSKNSI